MNDLHNEKEQLTNFLQSSQVSVTPLGNKLRLKSEKLSAQELRRVVTKFVYHRNSNITHLGSSQGITAKINRFKSIFKKENTKEERHIKPKSKAEDYDTFCT